jgi:short-subunit dehydrogenase
LTKGLAADLSEKKIRVNTVVPGLVQTELWDKLGRTKEQQQEQVETRAKTLPVGFVATPTHIAEAYVYAVRADYATGTLIEIGKLASFSLPNSRLTIEQMEERCCRIFRVIPDHRQGTNLGYYE